MKRADIHSSAEAMVRDAMGVKPDEKMLIVTDASQPQSIAEMLMAAGVSAGARVVSLVFPMASATGQEPPDHAARAMLDADVIFLYTAPFVDGSTAIKTACGNGTRVAFMVLCNPSKLQTRSPQYVEAAFVRATGIDVKRMANHTHQIADLVENAKKARLFTDAGTNLTMQLGNKVTRVDGLGTAKGAMPQLPGGVFAVLPYGDSANGTLVIDVSTPLGPLATPIVLTITDGYVARIDGSEAGRLRSYLASFNHPGVYRVSDWGVGTHPRAVECGNFREETRVLGWGHMGIGDDARFDGGRTSAPSHLDVVFRDVSLELDGELVVDRRKFLV